MVAARVRSGAPEATGAGSTAPTSAKNFFGKAWNMGMTADSCAEAVFSHVREGKLYVILENIIDGRPANVNGTIKRRYESFIARKILPRSGSSASLGSVPSAPSSSPDAARLCHARARIWYS